jgi:hypothetical protein
MTTLVVSAPLRAVTEPLIRGHKKAWRIKTQWHSNTREVVEAPKSPQAKRTLHF